MTTWLQRVLVLSGLWMAVVLPIAAGAQPQPEHSEAKESHASIWSQWGIRARPHLRSIHLRTPTSQKIALSSCRRSSEKASALFPQFVQVARQADLRRPTSSAR